MIQFRIENWFCYGLKISNPQAHWLKERHLEELKDVICEKVAEMLPDITLGLFVNH